ncbi:MAG: winged helix-turn-helix transcriptional regulator [FCB group bacterium]|nr:winged helix-turn-helix transcriptional regulator [FCB group bacterium]
MMELTRVFKALSDSNRIRIIEMISEKPLCVCEITAVLDLATSTVSKHLSILKDAGLILDEKDGKWVNYRLNETDGNDQIRHLIFLVKSWLRDSELILRDKVQLKSVDRNHICKGSS